MCFIYSCSVVYCVLALHTHFVLFSALRSTLFRHRCVGFWKIQNAAVEGRHRQTAKPRRICWVVSDSTPGTKVALSYSCMRVASICVGVWWVPLFVYGGKDGGLYSCMWIGVGSFYYCGTTFHNSDCIFICYITVLCHMTSWFYWFFYFSHPWFAQSFYFFVAQINDISNINVLSRWNAQYSEIVVKTVMYVLKTHEKIFYMPCYVLAPPL